MDNFWCRLLSLVCVNCSAVNGVFLSTYSIIISVTVHLIICLSPGRPADRFWSWKTRPSSTPRRPRRDRSSSERKLIVSKLLLNLANLSDSSFDRTFWLFITSFVIFYLILIYERNIHTQAFRCYSRSVPSSVQCQVNNISSFSHRAVTLLLNFIRRWNGYWRSN